MVTINFNVLKILDLLKVNKSLSLRQIAYELLIDRASPRLILENLIKDGVITKKKEILGNLNVITYSLKK